MSQKGYLPEMAGAPVTVISKLVGHSIIAVTSRHPDRRGRPAGAVGAYEYALALTENAAERAYLAARLAQQRPPHPHRIPQGHGQASGDGEAGGDFYPRAARVERGERHGDGAEEARRQHREEPR